MSSFKERYKQLKQALKKQGYPDATVHAYCGLASRSACLDELIRFLEEHPGEEKSHMVGFMYGKMNEYLSSHGYKNFREEEETCIFKGGTERLSGKEHDRILIEHAEKIDKEAHPWHYTDKMTD